MLRRSTKGDLLCTESGVCICRQSELEGYGEGHDKGSAVLVSCSHEFLGDSIK